MDSRVCHTAHNSVHNYLTHSDGYSAVHRQRIVFHIQLWYYIIGRQQIFGGNKYAFIKTLFII